MSFLGTFFGTQICNMLLILSRFHPASTLIQSGTINISKKLNNLLYRTQI